MANSPFVVGQTSPAFSWTWEDDSGNPINVAGATISVVFTKQPDGTSRTGDGTHAIINGAAGQTTYQQSVNDMAVGGTFIYRYKAILASGGVVFSDYQELRIDTV